MSTSDTSPASTNPYLDDPDYGLEVLDTMLRHCANTGMFDAEERTQMQAFLTRVTSRLYPVPLARPYTALEAKQATLDTDGEITAIIAVPLSTLTDGIDALNEFASQATVGDPDAMEGIGFTVVGGKAGTDTVFIEVTGTVYDWVQENTCRTPNCDGPMNDGEGWNGYCGNCADKRYGEDDAAED